MDKKELSEGLNKLLGVNWDWTKPLKKEQLQELYDFLDALNKLTEEGLDSLSLDDLRGIFGKKIVDKGREVAKSLIDKIFENRPGIIIKKD